MKRSRAMWQGSVMLLPLMLGVMPFGLIFGALALASGLSPLQTMGMSIIVFAGSAQFIAVSLIAAGVNLPVLWATTLVINLRHVLYSASVQPYLQNWPAPWRWLAAFVLTDELFAVFDRYLRTYGDSVEARWVLLGMGITMYGTWLASTLVGVLLGQQVPDLTGWGLEFAMVATFGAIVAIQLHERPMVVAALAAALTTLVCRGMPYKLDLIVATLAGIAAGVLFERQPREALA
ncbi:AzlC family ABC transporter permease [Chitinibacteraceae bacterium HSL-7]